MVGARIGDADRTVRRGLPNWFDRLVACAGLALLSLPLAALAVAVKLSSRGPVLHRAVRVGQHGEPITVLKFRTMRPAPGAHVTAADDPRITQVGRTLRRYKLDELPQLVNIVRGDMCLVGPRPEDPRYVDLDDDGQRALLQVRPGLTSPASVRFRNEEELLALATDREAEYRSVVLPAKHSVDLAWLRTRSARGDLGILLETAWSLLARKPPAGTGTD